MKGNNKARSYAVSDVNRGFAVSSACCLIVMVFGIILIAFGGRFGVNISLAGFLGLAAAAVMLIAEIFTMQSRKKRMFRYMQEYSFCMDAVTRTAVEAFIHPIAVINEDGEIIWGNSPFLKMIDRDSHFGEYIQDVFNNLSVDKYIESGTEVVDDFEYKERSYVIHGRAVSNASAGISLAALYFVDVTDAEKLRKTMEDSRSIQCLVVIDNYDEVIKETPNSNHGALIGEIERCVNSWVSSAGGVVRRYEREKFIVFFRSGEYRDIIEKQKYTVLADVRNINLENKIPVTLSIGTGCGGSSLDENNKMANLALEMALGRGGDQVVVKTPDSYKFYGAKTREVEKSTKVKARVIAHALRKIIDQSSKVIIMGHKNSDMDCLGASIGLYQAIRSRGADTYIAIRRASSNAKLLLDSFIDDPNYLNRIISGERAMSIVDKQSLVIVVDTHRRGMVEFEELLDEAGSVVLIDHHRRAEDYISNAVLTYHETYASSACEMVTEILQYIQDNPKITLKEAEALYAGIFLDTKGFTFKTGVRTFEAAAYLRRMGVDPVSVRRLFKSDLKESIRLSKALSTVTLYRGNIALVTLPENGRDMQVLAAKTADELLNIAGVEASFVIARSGHKIIISGRSLETINVQVILERLGGGGHITIAGAQLGSSDIDEAALKLKAAIDEALDE